MHEERSLVDVPSVGGGTPPTWLRLVRPPRGSTAERPLSHESVASVRAAALAIARHRIRYLAVVDDGTLVGIVAVPPVPRSGSSLRGTP